MLEKSLEQLCIVGVERIFGKGWKVEADQLFIKSAGRIDLLLSEPNGNRHVVEIKKRTPPDSAIDQVIRYRNALDQSYPESNVQGWVLAQNISDIFEMQAKESGVYCKEVSMEMVNQIKFDFKISETDLLGINRDENILRGGHGRISPLTLISNEVAFNEMPNELKMQLIELESKGIFTYESGTIQTALFYKNIKIGGINRGIKVGYLAIGLGSFMQELNSLGFIERTDKRNGHAWYQINWKHTDNIISAFLSASRIIDSAFKK